MFLFSLAIPQRAQAQRIDTEDRFIAQSRDNGCWSLREGSKGLSHFGVHIVNLGRSLNQIMFKGREDMFHRLDKIKTVAHAKRVNRAIDILGIGTVFHHWNVKHSGFQPEA